MGRRYTREMGNGFGKGMGGGISGGRRKPLEKAWILGLLEVDVCGLISRMYRMGSVPGRQGNPKRRESSMAKGGNLFMRPTWTMSGGVNR